MLIKKILFLAFLINLIINVIPIQRKTLTGTECPDYCYEYMTSYGFPVTIFKSNGLNSPIGALNTEILYVPYGIGYLIVLMIFLINGFFIAGVIASFVLIYKKIKKLVSQDSV